MIFIKSIRLGLIASCFLFFVCNLQAQVSGVTEAQVQRELEKRGLNEEEVRAELVANGYDPDNLENLSPVEIADLERIIVELEKRKKENFQESESTKSAKSDMGEGETTLKDLDKLEVIQDTIVEDVEEEFDFEEELAAAKIYGQEIFRNKTIKVYRQSEEIKAPEYYVLGAGDEIGISIWGRSSMDNEYTISKDGYIKILNGKQRILLKGLTLTQAREKLYKVFDIYFEFEEGQFEITLNYSRTIQITVYGDVLNPGPITIPALNTAFSALVAVNGPSDIGSVRNIKLIKNSGETKIIDVYEYMNDPSVAKNYYLEDADIIVVPVVEKVVTLGGAVNRPFKYELKKGEHLKELLEYAGGLKENAFTKTIQVRRYEGDRMDILDIPYSELLSKNSNFNLKNGDFIFVKSISTEIENYVTINGEVVDNGKFQRYDGMRVLDLIDIAGLTPRSKTDKAFLVRRNTDQSATYVRLNIDEIMSDKTSVTNLLLNDGDNLTIWAKSRFSDNMTVNIDGAVRSPGEFSFDSGQTTRVSDVIALAGGLRRDASAKAIIQRIDPLKNKSTVYDRVDLVEIMNNENSPRNVVLKAFDKIFVYSENDFLQTTYIEVQGAVNAPGEFVFGENMNLKDALLLAGGFKFGAALNKVEISRIVFEGNKPTKTIIATLEVDKDFNIIKSDNANFEMQPFDAVIVRYVPDFEFQKFVYLAGEVVYPGSYPIISSNEKISSIISRAGGLSEEGFAEGATLFRKKDDVGNVVIKMEEIMNDKNSRFNFIVQAGDSISIPKKKEFVTIVGATRVSEVISTDAIGDGNEINVPFHPGKRADFYINEYAGGIADDGNKNAVFVEHANGQIKKTKNNIIFKRYPEVKKGSIIKVGYKPVDVLKAKQEKEPIDWGRVLADSVAQATTVLTLVLLVQRLD